MREGDERRVTDRTPIIACIVARANEIVTDSLLRGAEAEFDDYGFNPAALEVTWVPGAAELPLAAQVAAESGKFDAVVCLGAIVKGETDHDQHLAQAVFPALQRVALEQSIPVTLGVITADTLVQALDRAGGKHGNAGRTALTAAIEMLEVLSDFRAPARGQEPGGIDLPLSPGEPEAEE